MAESAVINESINLPVNPDSVWLQMSGSLMAASAVEVLVGSLGLVGPLMRFVGPISVAPTITLIGLSLHKLPVQYARPCPPMAAA